MTLGSRRTRRLTLFILFCVLPLLAEAVPAAQEGLSILPFDQVKPGMKGVGRTVFLGTKIEEFEVEVIGVLRNFQPKMNMIVARVKHPVVDNAGVIQGMSGSPIYIDGKLVGALAYNIGEFLKEPLAGITPIGEMLTIPRESTSKASFSTPIPVRKYMTLDDLSAFWQERFPAAASRSGGDQMVRPMGVPLMINGMTSSTFEQARKFFSPLGFHPMMGGGSGQLDDKLNPAAHRLQGGDGIGVQMMTGDLDVTAFGTVTLVDGDKVFAFGHPMYNIGPTEYAMTRVEILTVVPSLQLSTKMAVPGRVVGSILQDRSTGVYGLLGKRPRMIPLNVEVYDEGGTMSSYGIQVAEDKILTPSFINIAVANILTAHQREYGDLTLEFIGDVFLENGQSIHLEDLFSGNFNSSVTNLSSLVASVVFFLSNNEFRDLSIHKIDLKIKASERTSTAFLDKVLCDRYDANPGEPIRIKVFYRTFRGEGHMEEIPLTTPSLPSGSEFYLVVADAASMSAIEMSQYRVRGFLPRSFYQLVRILSNLRKNNRIYFKIFASKPGLFLKGEEMPNLPPSMKSMFSSARAASSSPTELTRSTLGEYQMPVPHVFQGAVIIPIKIK
jgi:hypothetical protein